MRTIPNKYRHVQHCHFFKRKNVFSQLMVCQKFCLKIVLHDFLTLPFTNTISALYKKFYRIGIKYLITTYFRMHSMLSPKHIYFRYVFGGSGGFKFRFFLLFPIFIFYIVNKCTKYVTN